jgi:hypothetical protein
MRVEKRAVAREGKISFSEGGGINIVFGPKYRPLTICVHTLAGSLLHCLKPEGYYLHKYRSIVKKNQSIICRH